MSQELIRNSKSITDQAGHHKSSAAPQCIKASAALQRPPRGRLFKQSGRFEAVLLICYWEMDFPPPKDRLDIAHKKWFETTITILECIQKQLQSSFSMFFLSSCLSFQHCHHQCLCSSRYFECLATGHYIRTEIKDEKTVLMSESKNTNKYKRRHILWYMSPMDSRWFKQAEVYSKCLNGATALQKTAMIPWIHNGIKPFGTKME